MPPNAVTESTYRRMLAIYDHIQSGASSLQFDTSNFFKTEGGAAIDPVANPAGYAAAEARAAQFRQQYLGYLRDLLKTPAGLQLLQRLDTSEHSTTIKNTPGWNVTLPKNSDENILGYRDKDGRNGPGIDSVVGVDPTLKDWDGETCHQGKQPWMEDRPRFGFYHELVHAYHLNRGDMEPDGHSHAACVTEFPWELGKSEFQAVGLGPYAANAVSENTIRAQMGAPQRPTYSGTTWDGPDPWGQQRDAEEPPLRSPRR